MIGIDIGVILIYLIGLIAVGVMVSKRIKTHEDSMVAGRTLGTVLAAFGKTANLAGGSTSVGGTGYGYTYGFAGSWFGIGTALSALVNAPFVPRLWRAMSRGGFTSIGEYVGYRYGISARLFAGGLNTLAYTGIVAAQIIATGTIVHVLLGWSYNTSMIVTTIAVIAYTILGGLKAVVYIDVIQMIILYLGIVIILPPVALHSIGGWSELAQVVPEQFLSISSSVMNGPHIIGAILIPTVMSDLTIQVTYSYAASCKSSKAAFKSNFLTSLFYLPPAIIVVFLGVCALALYPDLASSSDALPTVIIRLLPQGVVGLLLASVLSATMSTSSMCLLCATNCLTVDIVGVLSKKERTPAQKLTLVRISMAVLGLLTLSVSLFYTDIIGIILIAYSIAVGSLLAPVLATMFWKRTTTPGALISMFAGAVAVLFVELTDFISVESLFVALPVSVVTLFAVTFATKPETDKLDIYFDDEWEKKHGKAADAN